MSYDPSRNKRITYCIKDLNGVDPVDGAGVRYMFDQITAGIGDITIDPPTLKHGCALPPILVKDVLAPTGEPWSPETFLDANYIFLIRNALVITIMDHHELTDPGAKFLASMSQPEPLTLEEHARLVGLAPNVHPDRKPPSAPATPMFPGRFPAQAEEEGKDSESISDDDQADPNATTVRPSTNILHTVAKDEPDRERVGKPSTSSNDDDVSDVRFPSYMLLAGNIKNEKPVHLIDLSEEQRTILKNFMDDITKCYPEFEGTEESAYDDNVNANGLGISVDDLLQAISREVSNCLRSLLRKYQRASEDTSAESAIYVAELKTAAMQICKDPVIILNKIVEYHQNTFIQTMAILSSIRDPPPCLRDVMFNERHRQPLSGTSLSAAFGLVTRGGDALGKTITSITKTTPQQEIKNMMRGLSNFVVQKESATESWFKLQDGYMHLIALECTTYHGKSTCLEALETQPSAQINTFCDGALRMLEHFAEEISASAGARVRSTLADTTQQIRKAESALTPEVDAIEVFSQMGYTLAQTIDKDLITDATGSLDSVGRPTKALDMEEIDIGRSRPSTRLRDEARRAKKTSLRTRRRAHASANHVSFVPDHEHDKPTANQIATAVCLYCGLDHPGGIKQCARKQWDRKHGQPGQNACPEYRSYNRAQGRNYLEPSASTVPFPDHMPAHIDLSDAPPPRDHSVKRLKQGTTKPAKANLLQEQQDYIMSLEQQVRRQERQLACLYESDTASDSSDIPSLASLTSSEDTSLNCVD